MNKRPLFGVVPNVPHTLVPKVYNALFFNFPHQSFCITAMLGWNDFAKSFVELLKLRKAQHQVG